MSSSRARDLPEELLGIISELILYEEKYKKPQIDNFQYEYAYDYADSIYDIGETEIDKDPTIIKISL